MISEKYSDTVSLPMVDGIDWDYAMIHYPDVEVMLYSLKTYYKGMKTLEENAIKFFKDIDDLNRLKEYEIAVHGMKSASASIGAVSLFALAKLLEYSAKDRKIERIKVLHPIFLEEWDAMHLKLEEIFDEKENTIVSEKIEDNAKVIQLLRDIRVAGTTLDIGILDTANEELKKYKISEEAQKYIEKLDEAVENLDSDQMEKYTNKAIKILKKF